MAPIRRDNPAPLFPSNTPEALAHLPAYNAYGDRRWVHPWTSEELGETAPLLISRREAVAVAAAAEIAAETGAPSSSESSIGPESTVEDEEPTPATPSLLSRLLAFLRAPILRLFALFARRPASSPLLPLFSPPRSPLSGAAAAPAPVPSSQVDSDDFAVYSLLSEEESEVD